MAFRIQRFMNDLGFRANSIPPLICDKIAYFLKGFDTLVVCARALGEDARLTSLLTRIDQVLTRNADIIQRHGRGGMQGEVPVDLIHDFGADLKSFETEIDGLYITLSNSLHSRSPTLIDVIEIIDSALEDLQNFHRLEFSDIGGETEGMEEKLQLFRNFIEFVEMLNVDEHQQMELEGFVTQVASVAVNAARVCARLYGLFDAWNVHGWKQVKRGWKQIQSQILALLKRIRPTSVTACQTYQTTLSILKSSEELRYIMDLDPCHNSLVKVTKDFIEFLLWCLWERLEMNSFLSNSMRDQVLPLWGSLKFLRSHAHKLDEKEIRMAICDAGIIIFSPLHQVFAIRGLVEIFKMMMLKAKERIPETSRLMDVSVEAEEGIPEEFDEANPAAVLRFLNYVLDNLIESRNFDDTLALRLDLVLKNYWLKLLVVLKNQQAEGIQALWIRAKGVAVSLSILWDHMVAENISVSVSPLAASISKAISDFREKFSKIYPGKMNEEDTEDSLKVADKEIVGLEAEIQIILHQLTTGSNQLEIIPIVGMAGLGKTTLALQVYNHPSVIHHFKCRAWCTASHVYNKKKLIIELLSQTQPSRFWGYLDMPEDDLANELRQSLKSWRYLVFLDNVWDFNMWKGCFPNDFTGSRILLTSRDRDVILPFEGPGLRCPRSGKILLTSRDREVIFSSSFIEKGPYLLCPRSDSEILEMLRTKLFPEDDFPPILRELGMRIAESCKGLPMAVVAVAGLLTTPKPKVWKEVLESLNSNFLSRTEQFINSSELSYRYLPDHLKPCFLSFGLFPEKEEVSAKWLYLLWIAEGLIHETQWKKLEDVARQYMKDLVNKSLVFVTKTTSLGEIKTCRVHESVHGFCTRKAEEVVFSQVLKGYEDILAVDELRGSQRLCIQSSRRDFKSLRMSCPDIHSLLFLPLKDSWPRVVDDVSFIVRVFKSLRVLHIRHINLGEVFPVEMKLLAELRYLAVRGNFVNLPLSIGNLTNLETLIVDSNLEITLPDTVWNLNKLRHLWIQNGFHFPVENLVDSSDLFQLETCSVVIVESSDILKKLFEKLTKVTKLKLKLTFKWHMLDTDEIYILRHLKILHVSMVGVEQRLPPFSNVGYLGLEQSLHRFWGVGYLRLRLLTLKDLELTNMEISSFGTLPCLESLKLLHVSIFGGRWHMEKKPYRERSSKEKEEKLFMRLKYLKLSDSNIHRWTIVDNHDLHKLEKLVLQGCVCLEEIPTECLGNSYWLQVIEVFDCSPSVELQVKQIQEKHWEHKNGYMKTIIS